MVHDDQFVLWSHHHALWWRPDAAGYTSNVLEAGIYTKAEADRYSSADSSAYPLHAVLCRIYGHPDRWPFFSSRSVAWSSVLREGPERRAAYKRGYQTGVPVIVGGDR